MKQKLLLTAMIIATMGVQLSKAQYTKANLIEDGWSLVTSTDQMTTDYYYILADKNAEVALEQLNGSNQGATYMCPWYKTIVSPYTNLYQVWTLAPNNTTITPSFTVTNVASPMRSLQTESSGAHRLRTHDNGAGDKSWLEFNFVYSDDCWTIETYKYTSASEERKYWGNWESNSVPEDGAELAGNKKPSHTGLGKYSIYRLAKTAFDEKRRSLASAAAPTDFTDFVQHPDFVKQSASNWTVEGTYGNSQAGNGAFEVWNITTASVTQSLSGLPNGLYKLSVDMISGSSSQKTGYAYASSDNEVSGDVVTAYPSTADYATMCLEVKGNTCNADNISVLDGTMTVGVKATSGWIVMDNFRLFYYGPTVRSEAVELPAGGAMTADQWYYYDIPVTGAYTVSAATGSIDNVVYTTEGLTLIENEGTISDVLSSEMTLTGTRYYFKASEAVTLSIDVQSYSYEVGTPTPNIANGVYIQTLTDFVLTFTNAATNDPDASFHILDGASVILSDGTTVAQGSLSVEGTILTATFSGITLAHGADYTVTIPAGTVGYNAENANEEYVYTFHTPIIFDGTYYIYSPVYDGFIGSGSALVNISDLTSTDNRNLPYVDNYGIPVIWEVGTDGYGTIHFADNDSYLTGTAWTTNDGTASNATKLMVYELEVAGSYEGYMLRRPSSSGEDRLYVRNEASGNTFPRRVAVNATVAGRGIDNCTWQFWTKAEHDAYVAGYAAENKTSVATSAGVSDLDTYIASLAAVDASSAIGTTSFGTDAGNWTYTAIYNKDATYPKYRVYDGVNECARIWGATGTYSNMIPAASLPAGVYKLTVGGFQRHASEALDIQAANNGYGAMSPAYVDVNGQQVALKTWMEMNQAAEADGQTVTCEGQTIEQAAQFIANGYADVSVFFYHDGVSDINMKLDIPSYRSDCYVVFNNFRLTQYLPNITVSDDDTEAPAACAMANVTLVRSVVEGYNSVCFPFSMTAEQVELVFGAGAEVYEFSDEGTSGQDVTINFTRKATATIDANVPVLVKASAAIAATAKQIGAVAIVSSEDPAQTGTYFDFVGNYVAGTAVQADDYYISQNTLYKSQGLAKQKSTRAYLRNKGAQEVKGLCFFDEAATAIAAIDNGEWKVENAAVYDLQGRRVQMPAKGFYLVNGKKILIK